MLTLLLGYKTCAGLGEIGRRPSAAQSVLLTAASFCMDCVLSLQTERPGFPQLLLPFFHQVYLTGYPCAGVFESTLPAVLHGPPRCRDESGLQEHSCWAVSSPE